MSRADQYAARVDAFVTPHVERARVGESHPVWDFLFSYYSLRPRQLRCWHPGYGVRLAGAEALRRYRDRRGYGSDATGSRSARTTCGAASTPSRSSRTCYARPSSGRPS